MHRPFLMRFVFIGLVIVGQSILLYRQANRTLAWLPTSGKILSAKIVETEDSESGKLYRAEIWYEYSANQVRYTSNTMWAGSSSVSYGGTLAQGVYKLVEKYPAG